MCGRFERHSTVHEFVDLVGQLDQPVDDEKLNERFPASYNVCPSNNIPLIRLDDDGYGELVALRWGLVPFWAKESLKTQPINARSETVHEKPMFRSAFAQRRCLVAADGWYEWQKTPSGKQPWYITLKDGGPFAFAGIWDSNSRGEQRIETCAILTTSPGEYLAEVHNRQPVIVRPEHFELWLDPEVTTRDQIEHALEPLDDASYERWPVSTMVNSPANNDPRLIERLTENHETSRDRETG